MSSQSNLNRRRHRQGSQNAPMAGQSSTGTTSAVAITNDGTTSSPVPYHDDSDMEIIDADSAPDFPLPSSSDRQQARRTKGKKEENAETDSTSDSRSGPEPGLGPEGGDRPSGGIWGKKAAVTTSAAPWIHIAAASGAAAAVNGVFAKL